MAHVHDIVDSDKRFSVNAITRAVKNESTTKVSLIQGDHNSERFTFEVPRYIEGHDMSLATEAQVHYLNVDVPGRYDAKDLRLAPDDEEKVVFSWLISRAATQKVGQLAFLVKFRCYDGNEVVYEWNSAPYTGIAVGTGMDNDEELVEIYADVMKAWEAKITEKFVMEDELAEAVDAIKIGGRNLLRAEMFAENKKVKTTQEFIFSGWGTAMIASENLVPALSPSTEYVISYDVELVERTDAPTFFSGSVGFRFYSSSTLGDVDARAVIPKEAEVGHKVSVRKVFTTPAEFPPVYQMLCYSRRWTTGGETPYGFDTVKVTNLKLEKGNKATDWTPAPEDMATKSYVDAAIAAALAAAGITN